MNLPRCWNYSLTKTASGLTTFRMNMNVCTTNHTATAPPWASAGENSVTDILLGVAFAANLLFGLPVNGYVLWIIVGGPQEKIASDFIPLNQIAVESLFCLSGIWYFLNHYISLRILMNIFQILCLMFIVMRPLVQSFICVEQYLATVHPVLFLRWKPLRYKGAVCFVSWLMLIALSVVGLAFNFSREFFYTIVALHLFFLLSMIFCCLSVLRALRRPGPGERLRDKQRGNSMKKKAFKIILINLVYTTVTQLPMPVGLSLIGAIPDPMFLTLSLVNIYIFVITSFVPSMLYLYRMGKPYNKCNCL